jgi:DNA-directed RNA polymerase subunit RPC12/RpoP
MEVEPDYKEIYCRKYADEIRQWDDDVRPEGSDRIIIKPRIRHMKRCEQRNKCANCKKELGLEFEIDHRIPLGDKGTNEYANLQALCPECHRRKTDAERFLNSKFTFRPSIQLKLDNKIDVTFDKARTDYYQYFVKTYDLDKKTDGSNHKQLCIGFMILSKLLAFSEGLIMASEFPGVDVEYLKKTLYIRDYTKIIPKFFGCATMFSSKNVNPIKTQRPRKLANVCEFIEKSSRTDDLAKATAHHIRSFLLS